MNAVTIATILGYISDATQVIPELITLAQKIEGGATVTEDDVSAAFAKYNLDHATLANDIGG